MRAIERIFVHCTASPQTWDTDDLLREFANKGWLHPGYHFAIDAKGVVHRLAEDSAVTNGVKGYNSTAINVAYIGGIDKKGKGVDNRTPEQKDALLILLKELKDKYPNAEILGHRDISPDQNKNGIVDAWERIKECPCFDARDEYKNL